MENKLTEMLGIETEENKKYCKFAKSIIKTIIISFFLFQFFGYTIVYFLESIGIDRLITEKILSNIFLIILFSFLLFPIYSIYLYRRSLISKLCFKKILIIWSIPLIIVLIATGGCVLLFSIF